MSATSPPAMLSSPPPRYDTSERVGQTNESELPAYTSGGAISSGRVVPLNALPLDLTEHVERSLTGARDSIPTKEYEYDLVKGKEKEGKKPWAFLTMLGDSTVSLSKGIPTIVEGQDVEGEVKVDLNGSEAFQAVVVSVRGQIIGGAQHSDVLTFLELSKTLWSSSPNPLSSASKAANLLPGPKSNKLHQGSHTWPFSIKLPKEVALTMGPRDAPKVEVCRLPQSFFERHARARVQYEVIVKFVRGLLKTDWRLSTQFAYVPITTSPSPSPLRVLAYQENTLLLGPEADPVGWVTLDPVRMRGRTENKEVDARFILSIADPLSYTRGSVIPLSLVIQCKDSRALELLSSPRSVVVRLRRCLRYHSDDHKAPDSYSWTDEYEHSELATWWPDSLVHPRARSLSNNLATSTARETPRHGSDSRNSSGSRERRTNASRSRSRDWSRSRESNNDAPLQTERHRERVESFTERQTRSLKGEIHLHATLKPSTAMTRFKVEYSVVLFPPDIVGFETFSTSSSQKVDILAEQPVEITTAFAPGPRPRMYAPPQYESGFPGVAVPADRINNLFSDPM